MTGRLLPNVTAVAIGGRGILIEGPPGSGKTSLALMLIDRGATLIGDDGIELRSDACLTAYPADKTRGLIEVRNVGIVAAECTGAPVCLLLSLSKTAPRFIDQPAMWDVAGHAVPAIEFRPGDPAQAIRAEYALRTYGLTPFPTQRIDI